MNDIKEARVLDVVAGRDQAAGEALWQAIPEPARQQVQAAAMDLSGSYVAATRAPAPQAAIVHDRFHLSKMLNESVDQTRRVEHMRLQAKGEDVLKGTRYLWLHGIVPDGKKESFAELLEINLQTSKAWCYKEQFTEFWAQPDAAQGARFFAQWYRSVSATRLTKVKAVAKTIKRHLVNLLTYFAHPITNAISEGFNSKIQALKSDARGFRSFTNYRARILFHCGKLNLAPILPLTPATH